MGTIGSLLLSLFSSFLSYRIAKLDKEDTFQKQNQLLDKQNQFTEEMWNKTNEYNSPESQLNRLMSAGASGGGALAMLGNQTANNVGSSGAPGVSGMDASLSNIFGDVGEKAAEIENLKADTRVKNADANRNETTLYYDIEKTKAETNKLAEELNLTSEQRKNFEIINKYADQKSQEEIRLIQENYKLVEQQVKNSKEEEKKQIWENFYRENFGIDVHDDAMKQIVSSSLKGDMPSVFSAFEKTANFVFSKLQELGKEGLNKITSSLGIPTDENGKPILNGSKYINSKPTLVNIMGIKSNGNNFRNPKHSPYYKMDKEMRKFGKGISQW